MGHSDIVETFLSSRKRSLLRRALRELESKIEKRRSDYRKQYNVTDKTATTHLSEIRALFSDLSLD